VFNANPEGTAIIEKEQILRVINRSNRKIISIDMTPSSNIVALNRSFPTTEPALGPGDTLSTKLTSSVKLPLTESQYAFLDLRLRFEDGKKFDKKIGVAFKKWR